MGAFPDGGVRAIVPTSIVLLVLAAGWGAYLVFWWRDTRRAATARTDRFGSFSSGMNQLGGSVARPLPLVSAPAVNLVPRNANAAAIRRRQVFVGLVGAAVVTLFAAVIIGPVGWFTHVLVDIAAGSYGYACHQRRHAAAEREIKVQMLYPEGVTPLHRAQARTVNA